MPEPREGKEMEELEEDLLSLFKFTEDYFSDNVAHENGSAHKSTRAEEAKAKGKKSLLRRRQLEKKKKRAIVEERRTHGPLRKSFKKDCERFNKKERQIRQRATMPPPAEIDTETFAGAIMVPKAKCQARSLAIDAGRD